MTQLPTLDTPASLTACGVLTRASEPPYDFPSADELGGSPCLLSDTRFTLALRHHGGTVSGFVWHDVIRAHL